MNKVELIDRAALVGELSKEARESVSNQTLSPYERAALCDLNRYAAKRINETPAIDAVPVVRCKDCALRGQDECPMMYVEDLWVDDDGWTDVEFVAHDQTTDDGFCHMGRRADDGKTD